MPGARRSRARSNVDAAEGRRGNELAGAKCLTTEASMLPRLLPELRPENQAELYETLAFLGLITRKAVNNIAMLEYAKPRWRTERHDQDYVAIELYNRQTSKGNP